MQSEHCNKWLRVTCRGVSHPDLADTINTLVAKRWVRPVYTDGFSILWKSDRFDAVRLELASVVEQCRIITNLLNTLLREEQAGTRE